MLAEKVFPGTRRARKAFAGNRDAFLRQITAEMEKYGLDGVEIDIESESDGLTDQDQSDYAGFVIGLAKELHSRGKIITLSSFPGRCGDGSDRTIPGGRTGRRWSMASRAWDTQRWGRPALRIGTAIKVKFPFGSRRG
jgi:hypothetical protein